MPQNHKDHEVVVNRVIPKGSLRDKVNRVNLWFLPALPTSLKRKRGEPARQVNLWLIN